MKALGNKVAFKDCPSVDILETFESPCLGFSNLDVEFETDEFTSLCPVTGQPDWVNIRITYTPNIKCLESKSLKLYLQSYRMEHGFMEQLADRIYTDLIFALNPSKLAVELKCTPRGGLTLKARRTS